MSGLPFWQMGLFCREEGGSATEDTEDTEGEEGRDSSGVGWSVSSAGSSSVLGGEEGAGLGLGVVAAVGLEAAEFLEGAVHHALQALFGGEEAFEGAVRAGAVALGVVGGGAGGRGR